MAFDKTAYSPSQVRFFKFSAINLEISTFVYQLSIADPEQVVTVNLPWVNPASPFLPPPHPFNPPNSRSILNSDHSMHNT